MENNLFLLLKITDNQALSCKATQEADCTMQPYFNPTRRNMEDDLKFFQMEGNLNFIQMEDYINCFENGRRHQSF